jgi:hypothetical protein
MAYRSAAGQELTTVATPSERLGDPQEVHGQPAAPDLAETAAEHLVVLVAQEDRHGVVLVESRDGDVERVQMVADVLPQVGGSVRLEADPQRTHCRRL